ncbi:hypothetical protein RND61_23685 [Streptomyces sp. TRM76323]|uniref:Uncharacterized protein n=1 Tax=Streptomyces tamarix TaxID=3078565 RepID=A0ABU3QQN4_9ACTN|nr:hypothetical protein [Streptomyces tamarix]MDT9685037.1 hypothetical protein [Streptomyces tamarix]
MPDTSAGRTVTITRAQDTGQIIARGGDGPAHGILERTFFLREAHGTTWHRLSPTIKPEEEPHVTRLAVERLQGAGYGVVADAEFASPLLGFQYVTTGRSIANLAVRVREASSAAEASDLLEEVTAAHDGILAFLDQMLHALADVYDRLGGPADRHSAARMRYLAAHRLGTISADLLHTRAELADRSAQPSRSGPAGPVPAPPAAPAPTASGRIR